jgi:hypothetical protein
VVAFCSMTMQHRIVIVMCKIWCNSGAGRWRHIHPHSPDLATCDYWLFVRTKEHLRGKRYESEYDINTVVTVHLHRLSKDEYKAATDRLPHRRKKYVDSAGDSLTTGNTCKHLQISVVLLTCISLLQ